MENQTQTKNLWQNPEIIDLDIRETESAETEDVEENAFSQPMS